MNGSVTHILAQVTLMFMNTNRMYIRGEKSVSILQAYFPGVGRDSPNIGVPEE